MSCFSHDGSFNSIRSWTMPGKITRNSSRLDAQALSPKRSLDSVHHTFASGSYATRTTISFSAIRNLVQCRAKLYHAGRHNGTGAWHVCVRVLLNPPSRVEWRVKENPPYAVSSNRSIHSARRPGGSRRP